MILDKTKVYIGRVNDYIPELLEARLREGFEAIGGIRELVSGKKVFVKINQLANRPPEEAVTTHPLVVEKVVKILLECGARIIVGDDIESRTQGEDGFLITGMREVCQRLGVELINLKTCPYEKIERRDNQFIKELYIARPVLEADIIVNLPKLKTHSQTVITAAIKNLYGLIPQGERGRLHAAYAGIDDFSEIVVDIFNSRRPSLNIMDAILAMEGEGPMGGTPRWLGLLLISRDAVAMDAVVSSIVGLSPGEVKHISKAAMRGLGSGNLAEMDIVGEPLEKLKLDDFKLPKITLQAFIPKALYKLVYKIIAIRPKILSEVCSLCSRCVERCPAEAMEIKKGKLTIDYRLCIGCLCCQEICASRAIKSFRSLPGEILMKMKKICS